jgi:hypothetical protein
VKARGALLALWTLSAALPAEGQAPDWFDAFRGKAYLQGDASFVARERSAGADAPPLFRLRWVVLRYGGFPEKEREFWPYRNLLLVTMPTGTRYVLESSFGFVDESHLEEERPFQRVSSERAAFEVWASGGVERGIGAADDPCEGLRQRVRATGGTLEFFLSDLSSPTVRTTLSEIVAATFDPDERRDLRTLLKVAPEGTPALPNDVIGLNVRNALFAAVVAFRDEVPAAPLRTVLLAPEPAASGDLAAWRALAHLPLDLPPFPLIPPENPIR